MELRQLRYFIAVADELHFTRAAAQLHVAQPALSHQIRQLEEEIGAVLLERTNRMVRLTPAGEAFRKRARLALDQAQRAAADAASIEQGWTGSISLGFVSSAVFSVLPELLRRCRKLIPDAEVELRELEPSEQLTAIRNEHLDLGIMHAALNDPELESVVLAREPLIVALPASHPAASQRKVSLRKLSAEALFLPKSHAAAGFHEVVMAACRQAGFVPAHTQTTKLLVTAVCLVRGRLGVALVPASFREILRIRGVVFRPLTGPSIEAELIAVWRRDNPSALMRRFREQISAMRAEKSGHKA
jgi:DNA-binding transcriptional LysR family regulator